jgi:hypothetical protein
MQKIHKDQLELFTIGEGGTYADSARRVASLRAKLGKIIYMEKAERVEYERLKKIEVLIKSAGAIRDQKYLVVDNERVPSGIVRLWRRILRDYPSNREWRKEQAKDIIAALKAFDVVLSFDETWAQSEG